MGNGGHGVHMVDVLLHVVVVSRNVSELVIHQPQDSVVKIVLDQADMFKYVIQSVAQFTANGDLG